MIFKHKLAQLDREIDTLQAAGDRDSEAATRAKKVIYYLLSFKLSAALAESAKIIALKGQADQYESLAQSLYLQGRQLSGRPGQEKAAQDLYNKAAAAFHVLEDRLGEASALKALAELEARAGNFSQAIKHLDKAIALFDNDDADLDLVIELYQLRGRCYACQGQAEQAWSDMDKALLLAQQIGDKILIRQVQSNRQTLPELLTKNKAAG